MSLTDYTAFASGLEDIHNQVHGWVGGTMSLLETSPADPLFWMHHANVDRLWWEWYEAGPKGPDQEPQLVGTEAIMDPWRHTEPHTRRLAQFHYTYA